MTKLWTRSSTQIAAYRRQWRTRWRQSLARRWLQAWAAELIGLLPGELSARIGMRDKTQRVSWPLPDALDSASPAILVLTAEQVMAQRISLPVAATRDLGKVLQYELDKYTPYAPEQVHFSARVMGKHADHADVELVAVASERLEQMIAACQARGLRLVAVDALDNKGERLDVDLLPSGSSSAPVRASALNRWLWAGGVAAAIALAVAYLDHRGQQLDVMQRTVAEQRQQVQRLQQVRQSLNDTLGAASYLADLKASRPTMSQLLAQMTTCLGEDSWVEQLEVRDGTHVTFSGQSRRASALITQVKTCPSLEQAQFQGIIQTDDSTGQERFSISARLKQGEPHAPSQ